MGKGVIKFITNERMQTRAILSFDNKEKASPWFEIWEMTEEREIQLIENARRIFFKEGNSYIFEIVYESTVPDMGENEERVRTMLRASEFLNLG